MSITVTNEDVDKTAQEMEEERSEKEECNTVSKMLSEESREERNEGEQKTKKQSQNNAQNPSCASVGEYMTYSIVYKVYTRPIKGSLPLL